MSNNNRNRNRNRQYNADKPFQASENAPREMTEFMLREKVTKDFERTVLKHYTAREEFLMLVAVDMNELKMNEQIALSIQINDTLLGANKKVVIDFFDNDSDRIEGFITQVLEVMKAGKGLRS
jgi:hypothetical protein